MQKYLTLSGEITTVTEDFFSNKDGSRLDDFIGCNLPMPQLRSIFRGHQHREAFSIRFHPKDKFYDITNQPNFPAQSRYKLDLDGLVYTFSSAAEGVMLARDCFGILTIKDTYDQWELDVFFRNLQEIANSPWAASKDKYMKITKKGLVGAKDDLIDIEYSDNPFSVPLDPKLYEATESDSLNLKLGLLKKSLNELSNKLETLRAGLSSLKTTLNK